MKVAVTGANGFVGQHTMHRLVQNGDAPIALIRDAKSLQNPATNHAVIPTLNSKTATPLLIQALQGSDAVVHLAAQVHDMTGKMPESAMRDINVDGSVRLLESAIAAKVQRFVFISSVKAVGEYTEHGAPFDNNTIPRPQDPYGQSKLDAESALVHMVEGTDTQLIILRPTFVYGWPLVGNFKLLVDTVRAGKRLPFKAVNNSRDMIYVGNLADAIATACHAKGVTHAPYFVCDGDPVSTPELIRRVAIAFGIPARLMSFPLTALRMAGALTGKSAAIQRLTENLEVDSSMFCRDAGWKPPYKMSEGLAFCAAAAQDAETDE